jgi:hypothetical protein
MLPRGTDEKHERVGRRDSQFPGQNKLPEHTAGMLNGAVPTVIRLGERQGNLKLQLRFICSHFLEENQLLLECL